MSVIPIIKWQNLIFLSLLFVLVACNEPQSKSIKKIDYKTWHKPITKVVIETLPIHYSSTGSIISDERIDVTSRTSGYIRKIVVREGENVIKGQPLIMLDETDIKGTINLAKTKVNKATSSLQDAKTDLKHYKKLFKRGSVSENTLRKTKLHHDVAIDVLAEAQTSLKTAISQQQYINITSPITGIVVVRHKHKGDLATPGTPILTIESNYDLLFETFVAETQIGKISQGDEVQVSIDALDKTFKGVIARLVPAGDPITRRYKVKISLAKQERLLSGMFGRALFHIGTKSMPMVATSAITERGGLKGVFILDNDNKIHFRWLQLGKIVNQQVEVRAGLKGGERIITIIDTKMREGDVINSEGISNE